MNRKTFILCFMFLWPLLNGCVGYSSYWAPTTQGGRLHYGDNCSWAPSNAVEFKLKDVIVDILGGGTSVGFSLRIPEGQSVSFVSDFILFYLPEPTSVKFDVLTYSPDPKNLEWEHYKPSSPLTRTFYTNRIRFSDSDNSQYRIKIPSIKINNEVLDIPEIEFTKNKGLGLYCIF